MKPGARAPATSVAVASQTPRCAQLLANIAPMSRIITIPHLNANEWY
jgi:hypothetical protein